LQIVTESGREGERGIKQARATERGRDRKMEGEREIESDRGSESKNENESERVRVGRSVYRGWVVLGSSLTDVLHDARVGTASNEHGLEVFGAVKKSSQDRVLVGVQHVEIKCSSGDGNDDLPRRDMSCTHAHMQVCSSV
jgi:hypothetical protein